MLNVYLHGEMGKLFGKEWTLAARSPSHALRLIEANSKGLLDWLRSKASKYTHYAVVCEFKDGSRKSLNDEDYLLNQGNLKSIHFTPVTIGAGGKASGLIKTVVGVALMVYAFYGGGPAAFMNGAAMAFGGISELLAPKPKKKAGNDRRTSHYFNGTEQTESQGAPIQLIYGRCLVQGTPISVSTNVDQLLTIQE
ncbi:tail assembly protein [Acinetobacter sp. A47]|uniref:tail assembly protein n=1 Tax=Acinetobacter sp. A47 TaxID=1561217 RepID=UPI00056FF0FE|nr:tail assembly protein [Acinetobacter sp. A47]